FHSVAYRRRAFSDVWPIYRYFFDFGNLLGGLCCGLLACRGDDHDEGNRQPSRLAERCGEINGMHRAVHLESCKVYWASVSFPTIPDCPVNGHVNACSHDIRLRFAASMMLFSLPAAQPNHLRQPTQHETMFM